jgi:starvation-inducible DNA-binding protein
VQTLKATKELAGEAGDNATDGVIDDWTDQAEQRAWFLREIIA